MYDPEAALQRERDLDNDDIRFGQVIRRLGVDHPWTQRVQLVTDILFTLSQKEDDLVNSFDPETQLDIEKQMKELREVAQEVLAC
jgi:hypothetical protein